jgi:hypothetical protein
MTTLKGWLRGYLRANWHISASQVTSGAEFRARFSRASMMALILLMVECEGELVA